MGVFFPSAQCNGKLKLTAFLWNPLTYLCLKEDLGTKKLHPSMAGNTCRHDTLEHTKTEHTVTTENFFLLLEHSVWSNKNLVTFTFLLFRLEGLGTWDALVVHLVVVQMEYRASPRGLDEVRRGLFIFQRAVPLRVALPVQAGFGHSYQLPVVLAVWTVLRFVPGWKAIFWRVEKYEMMSCWHCQDFAEIRSWKASGFSILWGWRDSHASLLDGSDKMQNLSALGV